MIIAHLLSRIRLALTWRLSSKASWLEQARQHTWIFVAGCNRSGKTTLSNLFRNHPEVTVIPNANTHTDALPESSREGCPHIWAEKLERFRLTEKDPIDPAYRLAFDWLHYEANPRRVMMIESDLPAVQMLWLQKVFPGAKLIGVVRNGYAVAQGLRMKEGYAIERCARQWRNATQAMLQDVPRIHEFKAITYEEFVERPREKAEELCRFIGVDFEPLKPALLHGWRLGNNDSHASTLRNDNAALIDALTPEELSAVRDAAGDLLDEFGYSVPGGMTKH